MMKYNIGVKSMTHATVVSPVTLRTLNFLTLLKFAFAKN